MNHNIFRILERGAMLKKLAREELDYRTYMLDKLKRIMAPVSLIENETRLATRAAELCRILDA